MFMVHACSIMTISICMCVCVVGDGSVGGGGGGYGTKGEDSPSNTHRGIVSVGGLGGAAYGSSPIDDLTLYKGIYRVRRERRIERHGIGMEIILFGIHFGLLLVVTGICCFRGGLIAFP
jgi:hypothetical protein